MREIVDMMHFKRHLTRELDEELIIWKAWDGAIFLKHQFTSRKTGKGIRNEGMIFDADGNSFHSRRH